MKYIFFIIKEVLIFFSLKLFFSLSGIFVLLFNKTAHTDKFSICYPVHVGMNSWENIRLFLDS